MTRLNGNGKHWFGARKTVPGLMAVLKEEPRYELLRLLAQRPRNVLEFMRELGMRQANVSTHLGILRDASLVTYDEFKSEHVYGLTEHVDAAIEGPTLYINIPSDDGDLLSIRTHIPFSTAPRQIMLWPWAEGVPARR